MCYNFLSFQAGGFCFEPGVLDAVRNEDATYIIPRTVSSSTKISSFSRLQKLNRVPVKFNVR